MSEASDGTPPQFRLEPGKGFNGQPEKFSADADGNITVENPGAVWHLLTLKHAIKLEGFGLRHSSGRSALQQARWLYGFKGNREAVLGQIDALLEQLRQQAIQADIAEQF